MSVDVILDEARKSVWGSFPGFISSDEFSENGFLI